MWFMYEPTKNIIAEFKEFYDTKLSKEEQKKSSYLHMTA